MIKLIESDRLVPTINKLIKPFATITEYDNWMPKSLQHNKEAELKDFLKHNFSHELGDKIHDWWLEIKPPLAQTPNFKTQ